MTPAHKTILRNPARGRSIPMMLFAHLTCSVASRFHYEQPEILPEIFVRGIRELYARNSDSARRAERRLGARLRPASSRPNKPYRLTSHSMATGLSAFTRSQ